MNEVEEDTIVVPHEAGETTGATAKETIEDTTEVIPEEPPTQRRAIKDINSGCSDHILNNDKKFEEYVTLKEPIEVKLGDGRVMKATKIGRSQKCIIYLPFANNRKKAKETLENIRTDLSGPHATTDYINLVENMTPKKVKNITYDNGKEYINSRVYKFASEKGIQILPRPPYVHELNGAVERYSRSVMDTARCLLKEAQVDCYSEVGYRVLINDRVIEVKHVDIVDVEVKCISFKDDEEVGSTKTATNENINDNTVNENIHNKKEHELVYESADSAEEDRAGVEEVKLRKSSRVRKVNTKYADDYVSYCIYVNYFDTNVPKNDQEAIKGNEAQNWREAMKKEIISINKNNTWFSVKKPNKKKVIEVKWVYKKKSHQEAIKGNEAQNWREAMKKEIISINKNNTWFSVKKPNKKKVIEVKWVYKKKSNGIYRARLVVKGNQQTEQVNDTYSPVAKMETLKILLSHC
ncbi:uncharacterized protein LOC105699268 [Orussus abietinus]|uniref:uncharacterized protein LOC105699268 n=1 Tax=Orussus abietinus TaxID=222816 RepID=UPI0006256B94|nr:uncharacterized protein LOC105699268 [Orussus abietinus]